MSGNLDLMQFNGYDNNNIIHHCNSARSCVGALKSNSFSDEEVVCHRHHLLLGTDYKTPNCKSEVMRINLIRLKDYRRDFRNNSTCNGFADPAGCEWELVGGGMQWLCPTNSVMATD